ncbi:MAG: hypothetical protein CMP49_03225 [Flavobacteriales bacterium]|nr:hypothetical protein [Flavobacteriales bacterium]|tara:strand:- start:17552 stop:18274 length:723 start_codon:yes stop_codon:yes gene_type:complete
MNNRQSGGEQGRKQGFQYEIEFLKLIQNKQNVLHKILNLKYLKNNINLSSNIEVNKLENSPEDLLTNEIKPAAADILLFTDKYFVGIDTKKPSSSQTQWVRKRIPLFLNLASNEEKKVFNEYFNYNENKKRTYIDTITKREIISNYINKLKYIMVKQRWRSYQTTWCDFIANHEKNTLKLVSVNEILEKEFTIDKMNMNRSNYYFGKHIAFKPYGSSQPDMQIQVRKSIFKSKYCIKIKF